MDEFTSDRAEHPASPGAAGDRAREIPVVVVGGGQAGLSTSYYLKRQGIDHVVLEKNRVGHAWREERWDTFCLVTPNWQCRLPDFPYQGADPDGFMVKDEIVAYVEAFARHVDAPLREGVAVRSITPRADGRFLVAASDATYLAEQVVLAISGYHQPAIPRVGDRLPRRLVQIHSRDYRNPGALPAGAVLVVGTGQSGCQIAEDLHLAGRQVHLAVGDAPRSPRRYRGKDAIRWLDEMGYYETTVDTHPLGPAVRAKANHYFTGRDGGREIDLRAFAAEGMRLYGTLDAVEGETVRFRPDLTRNLDDADAVYLRIRKMIDDYIARAGIDAPPAPPYRPPWRPAGDPATLDLAAEHIQSVVWCTGFRPDFSLVEAPMFNGRGEPVHQRGVTPVPGLYILGLGWLWTWGSGRFSGIADDARHVVETIAQRRRREPAPRQKVA